MLHSFSVEFSNMCESIFPSFWGLWAKDHSLHPAEGLQGRKTHPELWLQGSSGLGPQDQRQRVSGGLGSPRESRPPAAGGPPPGPAACRPPGRGEGDLQPEPEESRHNCAWLGFPTYPHTGLQDTGQGVSSPSKGLRGVRSQAAIAAPNSVSAQKPTCLH